MKIENHSDQEFDLIVLGGGINGLSVAYEAASRGLKTILFEQSDFGNGASSKTSKLAHGGIRYLEQGDIGVVYHSLLARRYLLENAPHLVHPLPFIYPVGKSTRPSWMIKLGLTLYDWLDYKGNLPRHKYVHNSELQSLFPELSLSGIHGSYLYYDALMDDVRLNMSTMKGAELKGAILINYTRVDRVEDYHTFVEVSYENLHGIKGVVRGKVLVNATGAWKSPVANLQDSSKCHLEPSKGVHLVLPQISESHALLLHAPQDRRVFFLIPWKGMTLLGTTETLFKEDPEKVVVTAADREYLSAAFRSYFPSWNGKVIAEFVGVRPLAASKNDILGNISRRYVLEHPSPNIISVLGGKYTTFYEVGREVVNYAADKLQVQKSMTQQLGVEGGNCLDLLKAEPKQLAEVASLSFDQIKRLVSIYGSHYTEIVDLIKQDPEEGKQICHLHPHLYAELTYAIRFEHAVTPEDWFYRRTSIGYTVCGGRSCYERTMAKFGQEKKS